MNAECSGARHCWHQYPGTESCREPSEWAERASSKGQREGTLYAVRWKALAKGICEGAENLPGPRKAPATCQSKSNSVSLLIHSVTPGKSLFF